MSTTDEQCLHFSDAGDDVLQLPKIGVSQISMKTRRVGLESLFVALCLLFAFPAYAVESIRSFNTDITVSADGSIEVVETIRVRAEGQRIRRGIYRDFTTDHIAPDGTNVHFDFQFIRVLRDGEADEYHQEPRKNGVRLYVGKADYFLPAGEYTYTIHYRAGHQIVFFDDHDVLYWNVAGSWPFAVEDASATVKLPDGIPQGSVTLDGYTGSYGSQEQAFESEMRSDGTAHFRATRVLQSEELLILVVVLPKGFVVDPTLSDDDEAEIMWATVEQSVESMCMCLGRRAMEEEMTFEEMSRSPEKLQTWSMEAYSGGRCRPTGILARMLGLQQESSGDESTEQGSPQSKSLWSEIELAEMTAGCVQSIMLPAKRDYTIRAQVSEGLNLARVAKAAIRERFHATGELAASNETAGLELANRLSGKYVSSVAVDAGSVVITYGNDAHVLIDGQTIVLTPEIQPNNQLNWTCSSHSIEPKHLPAACR